jgi:hypothetical protein
MFVERSTRKLVENGDETIARAEETSEMTSLRK